MSEKILSLHEKKVLEFDQKKMSVFLFVLVSIQVISGLTEELTEETDQNRLSKGNYHNFILCSMNSLICMLLRGCQIGMQGPQLWAKPHHCCKLDMATSRMAFLDLKLHVLQVATSNSNN